MTPRCPSMTWVCTGTGSFDFSPVSTGTTSMAYSIHSAMDLEAQGGSNGLRSEKWTLVS